MISSIARRSLILQRSTNESAQRCLTSTAVSVSRQRRKPKSRLSAAAFPPTTRDRVRWLQDHNQVLNDNYYQYKHLRRKIEDLGDTAEQRVYWLRDKIFNFWRGEPQPASSVEGAKPKRRRIGYKMDGKWWFWNILFHLMPAFLLFVYCQFIAVPRMLEFNRRLHIQEQKDKWGDLYKEEEDEELAQMVQDATPVGTKLYNSVQELLYYFLWQEPPPQTSDGLAMIPAKIKVSSQRPPLQQESASRSPATPTSNSQQDSVEAQTIAELKLKLEHLERRLKEKESSLSLQDESHPQRIPIEEDRAARKEKRNEQVRRLELVAASMEEDRKNQAPAWKRMYNVVSDFLKSQSTGGEQQRKESPLLNKEAAQSRLKEEVDKGTQTLDKSTNPDKETTEKQHAKSIEPVQPVTLARDNRSDTDIQQAPQESESAVRRSWWWGWWPKSS